jgi:hypothetical protein
LKKFGKFRILTQIKFAAPLWIRVLIALSVLGGAGAAHFAGFLSDVPVELRPLVARSMGPSFLWTLLFYIASIYIVSRIAAQFLVSMASLYHYYSSDSSKSPIKRVREHLALLAVERWFIYGMQCVIFVYLFFATYLNVDNGLLIFITLFLFLLLLVGIFLKLWKFVSINRQSMQLVGTRPSRLQGALLTSVLGSVAGFVLMMAYLAGDLRHNALWRKNVVVIQETRFSGRFNLIMESDQNMLLVQHNQFLDRHVFVTPNAIFYEIVVPPGNHPPFEEFLPRVSE